VLCIYFQYRVTRCFHLCSEEFWGLTACRIRSKVTATVNNCNIRLGPTQGRCQHFRNQSPLYWFPQDAWERHCSHHYMGYSFLLLFWFFRDSMWSGSCNITIVHGTMQRVSLRYPGSYNMYLHISCILTYPVITTASNIRHWREQLRKSLVHSQAFALCALN
jgi:hypothetical protein